MSAEPERGDLLGLGPIFAPCDLWHGSPDRPAIRSLPGRRSSWAPVWIRVWEPGENV